ncbi:MAG TPA: ComEC/Rec2 family competence protein, partial [Methylomirabilota bacterium]|nr:ComEC/Rec2 family competence protein [Methylomirabilota bacterium]
MADDLHAPPVGETGRRGDRAPSHRQIGVAFGRFVALAVRDGRRDLEGGRGFLWSPVAFAVAAAVYFALPFEPSAMAAVLPAAVLGTAALVVRMMRPTVPVVLVAGAIAAAGFLAAKVQVEAARSPVLIHGRVMEVTGSVAAVEDRGGRGHRLRIAVAAMDPAPREGMPEVVRVTVRGGDPPPSPGDRIRVTARLGPPQAPLYPGGYDFARTAFFAGVGGVGFALGPVDPAPLAAGDLGASTGQRIQAAVERFRIAVSARIRVALPGDAGAIAAALIVGDRGAIDPGTDDDMRVSGLSHILAISGLHMALVAACLFGGLRALLALSPTVTERVPIKQVAAAVALAGTLAYLVIAGMSLATQRSAVMIAITLTAMMIGRRPFSLRNVAVAALVVFALRPDAVLDPGAQLSFAAVTALIAGFEALSARRKPPPDGGDVVRWVRWAIAVPKWIGLSMLTSLLAGIATAPIALHHFNRAAPLSLIANLLATPLVSFLIMPAGLVAALAMPLDLDGWPLVAMGAGIDGMVWIAAVVADWTPGGGTLGRPALAGTLTVVAGGLWLCLWTGRARLVGIPVVLLGLALSPMGARPDLIVAGDGRRAMVILDGQAYLLGRPDTFETAIWLAAIGDPRDPLDPSLVAGVRCDAEACILREPAERVGASASEPSGILPGPADRTVGSDTIAVREPEERTGASASKPSGILRKQADHTGVSGSDTVALREPPNVAGARAFDLAGIMRDSADRAGTRGPDAGTLRESANLTGARTSDLAGPFRIAGQPHRDLVGRGGRRPVLAALVKHPAAFADECPHALLIVASIPAPDWCRAMTTVL